MNRSQIGSVIVGGFATARLTRSELTDEMVSDCNVARDSGRKSPPRLVFSSNGQGIALAGRDPAFARIMSEADIVHADGMSVVLASRLTSTPLPERIATTDFFHDAARAAAIHKLRFFILGGSDELNLRVVATIGSSYPEVEIAGRHHGYFDDTEDERVCGSIVACGTDIVWVALGKPRQEAWCVRNRERLRGVGWLKTCGGLYSFLTGDVPRAPQWMQGFGLEWLHRTMVEPGRLGMRYASTNPYAAYRLLRYTRSIATK